MTCLIFDTCIRYNELISTSEQSSNLIFVVVSINSNIEQIKTDISKDLKVSEQAAKDTVAAMQKLDKVAEQFNKAIVDMAQKNNELAEKVSKNEQKLTGIEKTNKLLIVLLIVSILVSVVARMI